MIYTQRIFWPSYNTQEKLSRLLKFLSIHKAICHEISFFTEGDGLDWRYLPHDEVERRADWLGKAVAQARAAGFATAVNVLNTLGHSDEGGENAPVVPWQPMVGHDGAACRYCSCPFDAEFLDDVVARYQTFARSGAGKYWIDDDVRMCNHAPAGWGCFCDQCLADFSGRQGRVFTRETLLEALRHETTVREGWLARNNEVMKGVLAACAVGVSQGEPEAQIGFMTCGICDLHDSGVDFTEWFGELTSRTRGQVWIRPGGGFWSDAQPRTLLQKLHSVSTCVNAVPPGVLATYEVENYPFIQGDKSAAQTGLECLLVALSGRIDGIMFDVLDPAGNDLSSFAEWTDDLARWRPLWDQAAELVQGTTPWGWKPAFSLRHFQQHSSAELDAMRHIGYQETLELLPAGLPLTAFDEGTAGHLLCGAAARGMSRAELEHLLTRPLLMDARAAQVFIDAGLGSQIGVVGVEEFSEGVHEEFLEHPWNGGAGGYRRSVTLSYFGARSYALAVGRDTEVLSRLRGTDGVDLGASFTLFRGSTGIPVAVMGHLPWKFVLSPQRMEQLQTVSQHMLGVRPLVSTRPVAVWWRRGSGKTVAVLYNAGFDEARRIEVPPGGALVLALPGVELQPETSTMTLPAWSVAVIEWTDT